MKPIKQYIGDAMKNKQFRFKCDCLFKIDVIGTVVDYEIYRDELILHVDTNGKIIKLGENHPNLQIEMIP